MPPTTSTKQWSLDELMNELRLRQSPSKKGRIRGPVGSTMTPQKKNLELATLDMPKLVGMVRGRQKVVYGVDDRKDLFEVTRKTVLRAADAVCALVKAKDLSPLPNGGWRLRTTSYRQTYKLCSSEPFVEQPLGCFCSGFLIGPNLLATAGHCVENTADLAGIRFVFGFRMKDGTQARTEFNRDEVYQGTEVVGRQLEGTIGRDWALVRLNRAVLGRKPVTFRRRGKILKNRDLFVIGHPNGLPAKYADGASVRDNSPQPYFVANLDTYGGNSGSPVFDKQRVRVEGILVRGENDFVKMGSCHVSLVCPSTGCRGEDVTRTTEWVDVFKQAKKGSKRVSKATGLKSSVGRKKVKKK
ncbi:MAG: serine protease [Nitrospirales bacterium]|nr:serine protease [Nitrospirales bacterium]